MDKNEQNLYNAFFLFNTTAHTWERDVCVCVCLQISAISLGSNFEQKIAEENVDSNNKILKV